MKKAVFIFVILCVTVFSIPALTTGDFLLLSPVAVKTAFPLYYLPEAFVDADTIPYVAGMMTLFTLPNGLLMYNVLTENREGTKLFRNITKFTDAGSGLLMAGYGIYLIAGPGQSGTGFDDIVGAGYIVFSIPVFLCAALDFIHYSFE